MQPFVLFVIHPRLHSAVWFALGLTFELLDSPNLRLLIASLSSLLFASPCLQLNRESQSKNAVKKRPPEDRTEKRRFLISHHMSVKLHLSQLLLGEKGPLFHLTKAVQK
jgi:hypothetical protein